MKRDRNTLKNLRTNERELGDLVSSALSVVGITEERVSNILGRPCGCANRKKMLNRLSRWAKRVMKGNNDDAEKYFEEIEDDYTKT